MADFERESGFFMAFGSNVSENIEESIAQLDLALEKIVAARGRILDLSPIYRTVSVPKGAGPDYANGVGLIAWELTPDEVLDVLHDIEAQMGRERKQRWAQRSLDLDLLAHGQDVVPSQGVFTKWAELAFDEQMRIAPSELILPHPRMQDRAFVLVPFCKIAPDWVHPVLKKTAQDLCSVLPEDAVNSVQLIETDGLASVKNWA